MSGKASSYNLALIAAYRKHPVLYDNRNRDYKVQSPTKEAWSTVAEICHSTPDECRSRWKALRDRFIKERKKRNSNSSYKVAWPLYNKMSFLEPFIENTFSRNKKEARSGISRLASAQNGDSRKTIDNVVELLVREASTSLVRNRLNGHSNDNNELSMVTVAKQELIDQPTADDGNELEQFYLKLIREVKKHQLLFDSSSPLYRVASARNRVWDEIALNFETFGEGYSAHELRTKWRSIRDRYIRERRLYKESLLEGSAKFPKWPLYPEFAFLDFYVDQSMPRTYQTTDNNNDNESVHSAEQDAAMNSFNNLSNDNEEADQSSPSSSSSTPSTASPNQPNNISVLQLLQKIIQHSDSSNNHHNRWQSNNTSNDNSLFNNHSGNSDTNAIILKNLSVLMQNPNFRHRNNTVTANPPSISSVSDGISEVLGELKSSLNKLMNLSNEMSENGLEYSFGQYVTNELIRTPEPKRSELRRSILTLLNENKFKVNVSSSTN